PCGCPSCWGERATGSTGNPWAARRKGMCALRKERRMSGGAASAAWNSFAPGWVPTDERDAFDGELLKRVVTGGAWQLSRPRPNNYEQRRIVQSTQVRVERFDRKRDLATDCAKSIVPPVAQG